MASGFIYLIILGMWVAYFLPRWISIHDESSGRRDERFKSAMRLVGENNKYVERMESMSLEKKHGLIARRRIIFSSLTLILSMSIFASAVGFLAPVILLIPVSALLIYFVNIRRQIVASQIKARRLAAIQKITQATVITETERITFPSQPVLPVDLKPDTEHWIPLTERVDTPGVVIIPKDQPGWEPVRVPKPTYVTSPKVVTGKRIIDLTVPGQWSEEQRRLQEMQNNAIAPHPDEVFDQELAEEAAIQRNQAVNE